MGAVPMSDWTVYRLTGDKLEQAAEKSGRGDDCGPGSIELSEKEREELPGKGNTEITRE